MLTRQQIKANAKAQLGGSIFSQNWLMGLLVMLVYGVIYGALSYTAIGAIIVYGPLTYGFSVVFLSLARGADKVEFSDLFSGFNDDFGGTFLIGLMTSIFTFLWSLLFVIPGIVKSYAYSMAFYIKKDNPQWGWKECIDESCRMMEGHKLDLFILDLSFIGWYIVGSLCIVGALWVYPYHMAAKANFYESIKEPTVSYSYTDPAQPTQML